MVVSVRCGGRKGGGKAVSVDKSCPATVTAGAQLQCTFTVTANGALDIALGSFTDATPPNTTFLGVTASGGLGSICPVVGSPSVGGTGTITCTVSVNGTGGPNTQTFTVTLLVDALATGTISNTACYNPGGLPIGQLCDTTTTTVNPIVARMRSVSATRARNGVVVRWRTASEIDMLGYNVYREVRGHRVRLNRLVIPAKNHAATYSYLDRTASKRPGRYYIQAISLDGTRSWFGPARVRG